MPFIIFTMLISIIVAAFAIQNAVVVPIKFMIYEQEASLVFVILGSVFLGLLIGVSLMMYIKFRNFLEARKKNETIKTLTDENLLLTTRVGQLEAQIKALTEKPVDVVEDVENAEPVVTTTVAEEKPE